MKTYALGMIETVGLTPLISALDEAVKASDVRVMKYEKVDAGIVTGFLIGSVSSVRAAIDSGVRMAEQLGGYRSAQIIAKPVEEIYSLLTGFQLFGNDKKELLQAMTIVELRKRAKELPHFPFSGRDLLKLKKTEIIDAMLELEGDLE